MKYHLTACRALAYPHGMTTKRRKADRLTHESRVLLTGPQKRQFTHAARRESLSLGAWMRMVATRAAQAQGERA